LDSISHGGATYRDGLYSAVPTGAYDNVHGQYKVWVEEFNVDMADNQLDTMGWTVSDIGTATTPSNTVAAPAHYLLVNPGTKGDSGTELQFKDAVTTGDVTQHHFIMPGWTNTATLFDSRSIFFEARVGYYSDTTAWDAKALIGFFVQDTTLLHATTGLPIIAAGGGLGFFIGEDGAVSYLNTNAAIVAAGTALSNSASWITAVASTPTWHTLGMRCDITDADAFTGTTYVYYDGVLTDTVTNTTAQPFDATDAYAFTLAILNGPARANDLCVDYVITGCTRPGLTTASTSGW
jgi:hypothetical protein